MSTIYQRVLQERFELLHSVLRCFLGNERGGRASGRLCVKRAPGRLRNLVASMFGIPPAGEYDVLLEVLPHGDGQRWVRHFGKYVLTTRQHESNGLLIESTGPASIGFQLLVQDGALLFRPCRAWAFGIPLPLWFAPHIEAENRPAAAGGWRVLVRFGVPLLGQVAEYEGEVLAREPIVIRH